MYGPAMHALAGAGRVVGGRYRLRDPIGRGAMGAVWRARDELLHRDVAVKEVKVPFALSEHDRAALYQRTLREAKTAARLNHPGVVTVFDVVEEDGRPWIVMELVQARSLDRVLAEDGPLPVPHAADVGQQLVGALATAHAAGILHRDVKPSNVLLAPDGRAVLTDFGIATFEGDERLTQTGMVMGTPEFTSPERIRGEPATPSSDLWSLGATLYAAVQGRGPYAERGGAITTMNAVLHEDARAAPSAGQLGPVISALMHRNPAARPDAARTSLLLSRVLSGEPPPLPGRSSPAGAPSALSGAASPSGPSMHGAPVPEATYQPPGPRYSGGPAPEPAPYQPPGTYYSGGPTPEAPPYQPPGMPYSGGQVPGAPPHQRAGTSFSGAALGSAPPYQPPTAGAGRARPGAAGPGHAATGRWSRQAGRNGRAALAASAALVIVAAGVIGGIAVTHGLRSSPVARDRGRRDTGHAAAPDPGPTSPRRGAARRRRAAATTLPAGYRWYSQPAASAAAAAGFRLAVPGGWNASTSGLTTYLRDPAGTGFMEIDLTRQSLALPLPEAYRLEAETVRQGKFPGYRRIAIRPVRVLGSAGAVWSFTWQERDVGRVFAEDYLFDLSIRGGMQSYAIYGSGLAGSWQQTARMLAEAIRTFQPLA
jgi:serine/threonine protein kinase